MKAVVFGGGNIGRGFLGQLLFESGFETVFVDINQMLLDELNARNRYPIKIVCNEYQKEITVENVRGVHSSQAAAEIADADILFTSACRISLRSSGKAWPCAKAVLISLSAKT